MIGERLCRALPSAVQQRYLAWRLAPLEAPLSVVRPHSLVTTLNLLFLENLAQRTNRDGVPGDFVECGVFRGGSAGMLAHELVTKSPHRRLWLFDAFAGMPEAGEHDDAYSHQIAGQYVGSEDQTRAILARLHIPEGRFRIVRGWFADTLPGRTEPGQVALLHVDCDFYDPVRLTLETFFARVAPGGFVVLNDYGSFAGCRTATDEFLAADGRGLRPVMIDRAAAFLQIP